MWLSAALALPTPAEAGPPFETDDTAPTSTHRWEVYLFTDAGGRGAEFDGSSGIDINHGLLPGVQATLTLPLDISTSGGPPVAIGDVDLGLKYRFWSRGDNRWSAALAPIVTIPFHGDAAAPARVGIRLPLWVGWESARWTIYGGGGLAISGETGGRHSAFGGVVVARKMTPDAQVGVELNWHGAEQFGERPETGIGMGCLFPLWHGLILHAAAGPRFISGEAPRYRFYTALAAQF